MRRTRMAIVVALVLGISLVSYAGATKVDLVPGPDWDSSTTGFMVVNYTPGGAVETTIQIQIRGAVGEAVYEVWSGGKFFGDFSTNKKGSGHIHINLGPDAESFGANINIWTEGKALRIITTPTP